MATTDVKQLLLQVDATVELLRRNLTAGDKVVAQFQQQTLQRLDATDKRFAQLGKGLTGVGPAVKQITAQISLLSNSAAIMEKRFAASSAAIRASLLSSAGGIAAALSVDKIKNFADNYTIFTNSLKVAGVEGRNLAVVQNNLYGIAQKYGVELGTIGALYAKTNTAAKDLGASQSQIQRFTQGVAAAVKIQGGGQGTNDALLQLSQLLGGTNVQAQEFNSLIDNLRPLLQAVANGSDKWGGSVNKLRADVVQGKVAVKDFFNAALVGLEGTEKQAASATLTISASFTILNNALGKYIGEADQGLSATQRVGAGIVGLANNLDIVIPALAGIAAGYAALKAGPVAFGAVTAIVARAAQADQDLAAQVLKGNASFINRAALAAKSAAAAKDAAAGEVAAIEATIGPLREQAAQLEANLALIREQRLAAQQSQAAIKEAQALGFGTLGQGGASRSGAQIDAGRALKAEIATKNALKATTVELAAAEDALVVAATRSAAATEASTAATAAATLGARASAAATALMAGAFDLLVGALPIIAIGAVTAAIIAFSEQADIAKKNAADLAALQNDLAEAAQRAATHGRDAATAISLVGTNAASSTGQVQQFAGAVGDAAQKLRELGIARRKQAVDDAADLVNRSKAQVEAQRSQKRTASLYESFAAGFLGPPALTGADKATASAQSQLTAAQAALATAQQQLAAARKTSPESYITDTDRTGSRDLKAELDRINVDLIAARKAGLKEQVNDLEAQAYERKRTMALMKSGQSFEAASAQASREASKIRAAGEAKLQGDAAKRDQRKTNAAIKDEAQDTRAYKAAERQALDSIASSHAELANSAAERAQIERDRIEADRQSKNEEIAQQGKAGRYTAERVAALQKLNDQAAQAATAVVDLRQRQQAEQDATDIAVHGLQAQRDILSLQGQLATTATERRAVALSILDLEYKEEKLRLARILAFDSPASASEKAQAVIDLNTLPARQAAATAVAVDQTRGPAEKFMDDLKSKNLNEELQNVKVHGLQGLEDGLVNIVTGTQSVASAFKSMATSIIADLARIAIEKAIVNAIGSSFLGFSAGGQVSGFSRGGAIAGFAGGGQIHGPGTGTSDSILAMVGKTPIRVANGEFIVNAQATQENLGLLRAINAGRVRKYADGGLVTPSAVYSPRVSSASLRAIAGQRQNGGGTVQHRVNVDVTPSPLFDAKVTQTASQIVYAAAPSIVAASTANTMDQLRKPSLPGSAG